VRLKIVVSSISVTCPEGVFGCGIYRSRLFNTIEVLLSVSSQPKQNKIYEQPDGRLGRQALNR
jgi:hypothetical protein